MKPSVQNTEIIKVGQSTVVRDDLLVVEEPLEIRIGFGSQGTRMQERISVTMRTPGSDFELALGFLYTEGIISDYHDVESIKYCEDLGKQEEYENVVRIELRPQVEIDLNQIKRNFYTTSSCGVCGKASIESITTSCPTLIPNLPVTSAKLISSAPDILRNAQHVFEHTGGLHAAGLFDAHCNLILLREDVGRHNAVDKVVGAAISKGMVPLSSHFVLVSGRASFELVQKCLMAGVPILAAVGSPSSLAVNLAKEFEMTLVGFVRNGSFNIYSGKERIRYHED